MTEILGAPLVLSEDSEGGRSSNSVECILQRVDKDFIEVRNLIVTTQTSGENSRLSNRPANGFLQQKVIS